MPGLNELLALSQPEKAQGHGVGDDIPRSGAGQLVSPGVVSDNLRTPVGKTVLFLCVLRHGPEKAVVLIGGIRAHLLIEGLGTAGVLPALKGVKKDEMPVQPCGEPDQIVKAADGQIINPIDCLKQGRAALQALADGIFYTHSINPL